MASALNIFINQLTSWYAALFFLIPVGIGAYGILARRRSFVFSATLSLVLVSLRPGVGPDPLMLPFLLGLLLFFEGSEASIRLETMNAQVKRSYLLKGSLALFAAFAFSALIYFLVPRLPLLLNEASSKAAILYTIHLPIVAGLAVLLLLVLVKAAIDG